MLQMMLASKEAEHGSENIRYVWGHAIHLNKQHLGPQEMYPLRFTYDTLADECLEILNTISPPARADSTADPTKKRPTRDLYGLLRDYADEHDALHRLWSEVHHVPQWVDWEQIARGQDVFYRYAEAILNGLAFCSLLGGMDAARVTEVLARTGGFSTKAARRRMLETTQHLLQVSRDLEGIQPGGTGHIASIRVRLLHAQVRQRILRLAHECPDYYDVEVFGIPINDLDCMGTIMSFSGVIIWLALPRQGIILTAQEIQDYMALWRLVAHYMGTPTDYFADPSMTRSLMESFLMYEFQPSETSGILANNIIAALQGQPPGFASAGFMCANARWLNGHELSDALQIPKSTLYYRTLVLGQCILFMFNGYTSRYLPWLDRRRLKVGPAARSPIVLMAPNFARPHPDSLQILKRGLYEVLVHHKAIGLGAETLFPFQYMPEARVTRTERSAADKAAVPLPASALSLERRSLTALVCTVVGALLVYWGVSRTVRLTSLGLR